jgi:hypothetical protein
MMQLNCWGKAGAYSPREVTETAFARRGGKAEQAYRRGDALHKMDAWEEYSESEPPAKAIT